MRIFSYRGTDSMAPDEWLFGNVPVDTGIPAHLRELSTARLGTDARDWNGIRLPNYRPLFIGSADAERFGEIMMARITANRGEK